MKDGFEFKVGKITITCVFETAEAESTSPHLHNGYEIFYLCSGNCKYMIDGITYSLNKGGMILLGPNHMHYINEGKGKKYLKINIENGVMKSLLSSLHDIDLALTDKLILQLPGDCMEKAEYILDEIYFAAIEKKIGFESLIRIKILETIIFALNHTDSSVNIKPLGNRQKLVTATCDYLFENYDKMFVLDDLCASFFVSKYYLCHIFKETTGYTILQYLSQIRVLNACILLVKNPDMKVTEIASRCGFNCLSSFNRTFKASTGVSPINYVKSKTH